MTHLFVECLIIAAIVMAAAGCDPTRLAAALAVRLFVPEPVGAPTRWPSVTIMKPLYGAEPGLFDNLASFCDQHYDAPLQWIFGVHDTRAIPRRRWSSACEPSGRIWISSSS